METETETMMTAPGQQQECCLIAPGPKDGAKKQTTQQLEGEPRTTNAEPRISNGGLRCSLKWDKHCSPSACDIGFMYFWVTHEIWSKINN